MMYFLCTLCAGSAIVQGMDQSAVNGAQYFYFREFGIEDPDQYASIQGLINGAPYLCSAVIGCWTNPILNRFLGRRGTIFVSCGMSVITGIWMAAADTWVNLLIARLALGFAIGAKSSTTPVYSAESTPKAIRGALTMMWQMWTAFGIALGTIVGVAFANVTTFGEDTQWRWIMASTSVPPLIVMLQVYFCPESPRWYMERGRYTDAFKSVCRLRYTHVQAARDMYYAYKLLQIEAAEREGHKWTDFFTVRRNRRAAQSAWFVMFMQQVSHEAYHCHLFQVTLRLTHDLVLWCQRHRLLLDAHVPERGLRPGPGASCDHGNGSRQLDLRYPGCLHHRHFRTP
jgi:MFS family permease